MTENLDSNLLKLTKKYSVIYADPPWDFKSWSQKGEVKSAQNHYACMSMEDIGNLPVSSILDENAILFMWVTDPLLPKQIEIMEKWGFTYRTVGFVWVKMNKKSLTPFIGLGYYTRSNPEYLLIGVKGSVGRPKDKSISEIVMEPIREHSRKPDCIRDYIDRMYPDGNRLEMFARNRSFGWDVIGNQTDKFDPIETKSNIDSFFD